MVHLPASQDPTIQEVPKGDRLGVWASDPRPANHEEASDPSASPDGKGTIPTIYVRHLFQFLCSGAV